MDSLFKETEPPERSQKAPLAELMRPTSLKQFRGQDHLVGPGKPLRIAIETDTLPSMILWGPPGVGKTTLAHIVAEATKSAFLTFSAVLSGIKEIKEIMALAERSQDQSRRTILFVDEIHRFNKAQQDAFLPYVEKGSITLIGATTENPSFEVISSLLSRLRVFVLEALRDEDLHALLSIAAKRSGCRLTEEATWAIVKLSNGDARVAYNLLELAANSIREGDEISSTLIQEVAQQKLAPYDKNGEEHFNIISALHKSLRNSDVDASLYWLARTLEGGEDPLYIARRLVRFASEDIGLADPSALRVALSAKEAVAFIGLPEGKLALAQCAIYLAVAPKSNSVYKAYTAAAREARDHRAEPVPLHLRNRTTDLMKRLDYGKDYEYAHDTAEGVSDMECLPEGLIGRNFYKPKNIGTEARVIKRLAEIKAKKKR